MSSVSLSTDQKMKAAILMANEQNLPVSKALKYVRQLHYVTLTYLLRVVDHDPKEFTKWFKQQRVRKRTEWDLRPAMQSRIASLQHKTKVASALSG